MDIENKYYNAKQIKIDNPQEAIEEFLGLPALEEEKGDWYEPQDMSTLILTILGASRV